jgi:hypothetical protein
MFRKNSAVTVALVIGLIVAVYACQPASNSNVNSNANANTNSQPTNANMNAATSSDTNSPFNAKEPDKYSATLSFTIQTSGGDKAIGIPQLAVQVARNGDDRRVEFKLPDGTPLIYLDHQNHHYVIAPARKQYAELSKEATGAQFQKLMTPGQIVEDLKNKSGVEKVGDETINGRAAEKYRYATAKNTDTKAGEVKAEAFVYIDKETRLPLRTEVNAESSGNVKGVNAARAIVELRDINTNIDASIFEVPTGYSQVAPEKVREQIDAVTSAVAAVLKTMIANMRNDAGASPAPTGSPQ